MEFDTPDEVKSRLIVGIDRVLSVSRLLGGPDAAERAILEATKLTLNEEPLVAFAIFQRLKKG